MSKWALGILGTVVTTLLIATVTGAPGAVMSHLDNHNDKRYLQIASWEKQQMQQQLSNFREEKNTLEWRKSQAQTEGQKQLIDQQLKALEAERKDYIEMNRRR